MSGLPKKKSSKVVPSVTNKLVRPQDVALKPKPSLNAPKKAKAQGSVAGAVPPKRPKLDFSGPSTSAIPAGKPAGPTVAGAFLRPPLDNSWRDFCKTTTVEIETFKETVDQSLEKQKPNKVARLFTAVFRLIYDKKDEIADIPAEYTTVIIPHILKVLKDEGTTIQNIFFQKCLLALWCTLRSFPLQLQTEIVNVLTLIVEKATRLDPYYMIAYLHDSLQDRHWVDRAECKLVVSSILAPFNTTYPTRENYTSCMTELPQNVLNGLAPDKDIPNKFVTENESDDIFEGVLDVLKKWWLSDSPPKNLMRTMCVLCGLREVRLAAARRLDVWSQNGKIQRQALELLLFLGCNFGPAISSGIDGETMALFIKMKCLKSKPVMTVFTVAAKEMLLRDSGNIRAATRLIIANEFGPQRFTMNITLLHMLSAYNPEMATKVIAEELSRVVLTREEFAKPARLFAREYIRSLRTDFNFSLFADAYLNLIIDEAYQGEHGIEDHVHRSATEVITMLPFVAVTSSIRESAGLRRSGSTLPPEINVILNKFETDLLSYFEVCLRWLLGAKMIFSEYSDYVTAYHRYLFLEKPEYYITMDQGPTESEYSHCAKLIAECGISDGMLWLIAGETFHTLLPADVITVIDELTRRTIAFRLPSCNVIHFNSDKPATSLVERLLNITICPHDSSNIAKNLASVYKINLYWKAWLIAVKLICLSKSDISINSVMSGFPTFRLFVYMVLTKQYKYPIAFEGKSEQTMVEEEANFAEAELEKISSDENILQWYEKKGVDIVANSLNNIMPHYCAAKPREVIREIPDSTFSELSSFAKEQHLAAELCVCREPDLLADLIRNEGVAKAMHAIQELLNANSSSILELPLIVVCQFLVFHWSSSSKKKISDEKIAQIVNRLRTSADDSKSECLQFLLRRLSSSASERTATEKVLSILANDSPDTVFSIPNLLPLIKRLNLSEEAVLTLAKAVSHETNPTKVGELLEACANIMDLGTMHQAAVHISPLTDRFSGVFADKLLVFYGPYFEQSAKNGTKWPEHDVQGDKRLTITDSTGTFYTISNALFSIIKLLCKTDSSSGPQRESLMKMFFPSSGTPPTAKDGSETVNYLSEAVMSNMLCAKDENLAQVALSSVKGMDALPLLCSFGLTTFAATRLLSILDNVSIKGIEMATAVDALRFSTAYRLRGATGGEKFIHELETILAQRQSLAKDEPMDTEIFVVEQVSLKEKINIAHENMAKADVVKLLKDNTQACVPHLFGFPTALTRSALHSEDVAFACIEHFETNLKFFLDNTHAFHRMMTVISGCADKFDKVKTRLTSLASRVLKSASIPSCLEGYFDKYASKTKKTTEKHIHDPEKMSPDQILKWMNSQESINQSDRAKFLNAFLDKRPEVLERNLDTGSIDNQLLPLLCGKNGVESLVGQLPTRGHPKTKRAVLYRLLKIYEPKYDSLLVCELLSSYAVKEYSSHLTNDQLTVLSKYLVGFVLKEENLDIVITIIEDLVKSSSFQVLVPIGTALYTTERSDDEFDRRKAAEKLLKRLREEFPCLMIDLLSSKVSVLGTKWRKSEGDRLATSLIELLYTDDEDSTHLETLNQLLESHPAVMGRQFGVLVNQMSMFLSIDSKEAKSATKKSILQLTRLAAVQLLPKLQYSELHNIDTLLQLLFVIFERHYAESSHAIEVSSNILQLCKAYLVLHPNRAKEVLVDQQSSIEMLFQMCPELQETLYVQEQMKLVIDTQSG